MLINGHKLPESFVRAIDQKTLYRKVGCWELKDNLDSFGNKLETDLGQIYSTEEEILKETTDLKNGFGPSDYYGGDSEYSGEPGFIDDIVNFTDIVTFAMSADGAPFCFDFRNNKESPEVIWWDDVYWRKVSDNYDEFISLFETNS